ncbi:MAG: hypothetical protein AAFV47_07655 [Pseudomonadota bacterium]
MNKKLRFKYLSRYQVGGTGDRMQLAIPAPTSPSGKSYQYSPNPDAPPRLFLIGDLEPLEARQSPSPPMRRRPGPGQTVCPYSGVMADDEEFTHFDDLRVIKEHIQRLAAADVEDHLAEMAKDFNRRQPRNSLISLSMDVPRQARSRVARPLAIRQDLMRNVDCTLCGRHYAVYAIALYCPDCGAPNLLRHFDRELGLIDAQIALVDASEGEMDKELAYRLLGNAHEDVLTAFEAALKVAYLQIASMRTADSETPPLPAAPNAFQNMKKGSAAFKQLGIDLYGGLDDEQRKGLSDHVQRRHVIGHNLGIADDLFQKLTDSGEVGRTVSIVADDIRAFGGLCRLVIEDVERHLAYEAEFD